MVLQPVALPDGFVPMSAAIAAPARPIEDEPAPPDAPPWMTHEAAYGWSCGWAEGYRAAQFGRSGGPDV